jgi:nucleoid-associated protein YgaU
MGLLDFIKDAGRDLFGNEKGTEAAKIKAEVERELGNNVRGLGVVYKDGQVTLHGEASSQAAKEKAVLIAGNVRGVSAVNDDSLTVAAQRAGATAAAQPAAAQPRYYTIQSGDSLSKVAKEFYGDANRWNDLFEANREVIKDPDKIYPGQRIRVPQA